MKRRRQIILVCGRELNFPREADDYSTTGMYLKVVYGGKIRELTKVFRKEWQTDWLPDCRSRVGIPLSIGRFPLYDRKIANIFRWDFLLLKKQCAKLFTALKVCLSCHMFKHNTVNTLRIWKMIGPQGTNQMREKLWQVLNEKSTSKCKRKISILEVF